MTILDDLGLRAACCRFPGASLLARIRSRLRILKAAAGCTQSKVLKLASLLG